jgi:hypothetical protein
VAWPMRLGCAGRRPPRVSRRHDLKLSRRCVGKESAAGNGAGAAPSVGDAEMGGGWERRRGQGERSGGGWEELCGFGLFARRLF